MAYTPDPTDSTQPTDSVIAETAQAELRALKGYLQSILATIAGTPIGSLQFKDSLIRNGEFNIWQRNTTFALAATGLTADGWKHGIAGAGRTTDARIAGMDQYSPFSFQATVTTPSGALGAGDNYVIQQVLPGNRISRLGWGAAGARTVSMSFIASFAVAGLHAVSIRNNAADRSYIATFNVLPAQVGTPTLYTLPNIPGDTAGAWGTSSTASMIISFILASGSNFQSAITDAWQPGNFIASAGVVNEMATNGNVIKIGRVRFTDETACSPFVSRGFEADLDECLNFYEKSFDYAQPAVQNAGSYSGAMFMCQVVGATTVNLGWSTGYKKKKNNAAPTLTFFNPVNNNALVRNINAVADCSAPAVQDSGDAGFAIGFTTSVGSAIGQPNAVHWTSDAEL